MTGFIIVAIVFASVLAIVKMTLDYNKSIRLQESQRSSDDRSLKTSELKALIREAVQEEVHPLSDRMDRLEQKLLPAASSEDADRDNKSSDIVHHEHED